MMRQLTLRYTASMVSALRDAARGPAGLSACVLIVVSNALLSGASYAAPRRVNLSALRQAAEGALRPLEGLVQDKDADRAPPAPRLQAPHLPGTQDRGPCRRARRERRAGSRRTGGQRPHRQPLECLRHARVVPADAHGVSQRA